LLIAHAKKIAVRDTDPSNEQIVSLMPKKRAGRNCGGDADTSCLPSSLMKTNHKASYHFPSDIEQLKLPRGYAYVNLPVSAHIMQAISVLKYRAHRSSAATS
jgi:hypothetical protein